MGCNFLPSTAVNDIEMWQAATYDPKTIDRELGFAEGLGYNTVRVFLNFVVWKADPEGLKMHMADFLAIAARHRISVMFAPFGRLQFCGARGSGRASAGTREGRTQQPMGLEPSAGHGHQSHDMARGESLRQGHRPCIRRDPRVSVWDVYNEAGNSGLGEKSLPLVEAAFAWARQTNPTQPLTSCSWTLFDGTLGQRVMELSDVVSFHCYGPPDDFRSKIAICRKFGRPLICTEWLHRGGGNTVAAILPILHDNKIGSYNWGLVAGRTQTFMPWGSKPGTPIPKLWQHDLFHADGTPFSLDESSFIKHITGVSDRP